MTTDIDVNIEPLPGYRLIEHLGTGGYGEVWRAEAPGGLTKAIKFVFGQHHEKRAANELRALQHIRGVRHPFLLSLERIEVVDGRLLVVSELADGSVKDRFEACRREGLAGIPRGELLEYLRDAADALDFMSQSHALQHLDIKPENLLVLAGHVKVADFGLVKDVRQSQASLVGGMTPLYAAPEVFRGAPSGHSDQYSLAIVYQEMLTGTLPFAGCNAAELTLQHLNEEPDLSPLSAADRYAVSRALAKDPQHRYPTCRAFVEALLKAEANPVGAEAASRSMPFAAPAEFTGGATGPVVPTDVFDECESADWQATSAEMLVELPPTDFRMVDLPPVDLATRDVRPVPTLVLGIGGTAGHVLSRLRRMIREQLGKNGSVPAVQFLLIDTDPRAISDASGDGGGLSSEETLNLPLRRPQHYRERAQQLLHWLSRRWLYNIPRSLRTEGLRPLGRLALADHARQTVQRVRRAMTQSVDAESIAASSRALGQQFRADALHVYVVASISGGTGGGMAIDIGYAVRSMLEKLGLKDTHVCGIMMHSTGGDPRHCELARVNAFSWLTEFNHFQQGDHAYPGDPSCGLPAHLGGVPPFDRTYLVHLGENLGGVEFDQATQSVAEYLQLSTLTPASSFLAACREAAKCQSETKPVGTATRLRSFGIYRRTAAPSEFCEHFASVVSRQVLSNWWPAEPASAGNRQSQATQDAMQLARRLQLDSAGMATNARALVDLQLGTDAATFLSVWFNKHGLAAEATEHARLEVVDRVFGPAEPTGSEDQKISLLGGSVAAIVEPLAEKLRGEVRRWISSRIDDTRERLAGARQFTNTSHDHFHQTQADLRRLHRAAIDKMLEVRRDILAAIPASGGAVRLTNYFRLRLDQVAILAAEHAVQLLVCDAKAVADEITALGREIDQIAATVARSANPACEAQASGRLASALHGRLRDIAAHVDSQVQAEYINQHGGLWKLIMQGGRPRAQLTAKLHELSRQAVHDALAGVNVLAEALGADCGGTNTQLHSGLALATPALLEFGGTRRTLAILPRDSAAQLNPTEFVHSLGAPATLMIGPNNSLTLCVEADQLALRHIALELVQRRRDRVEFADRVHCRTDIAWTPLVTGSGTSDPAVWSGNNARTTQSQQAMSKTVVM